MGRADSIFAALGQLVQDVVLGLGLPHSMDGGDGEFSLILLLGRVVLFPCYLMAALCIASTHHSVVAALVFPVVGQCFVDLGHAGYCGLPPTDYLLG